MPSVYCPTNGHRVTFNGARPAKCPVCQTSLETPSFAAIAATITAAPAASAPAAPAARQGWPKQTASRKAPEFHVQQADFGDEDYTFDGDLSISSEEDGPLTVEQLARSDTPIERAEARRAALDGRNEVVTAASLVDEMIRQGGGQVATASTKRTRAPRSTARKTPAKAGRAPKGAR